MINFIVAKDLEINHIAIAGGVSANSGLQQAIKNTVKNTLGKPIFKI